MKRLAAGIAVLVALLLAMASPSLAKDHHGRWERLGSRSVGLGVDRDVIPVTVARGDFRKLKLLVRENGIFVHDLTVVYANGVRDRIPITTMIPRNGETRVIDLRGGERMIRQVELTYRSVHNGRGRALVEVWAKN